ILQGVDLDLYPGEIVTVIGANGAGKSTLMKALFGLIKPRSGQVSLDESDITGAGPATLVGRGVAYVPQNQNVFAELTVDENLEMGAFALSREQRKQMARRKAEVFQLFGDLKDRRRQRAGDLSGGQQQMVAIGRAWMTRPAVLFLDEPTAGLSPKLAREILAKVAEINRQGVSVLMIEQNAAAALAMSHHAYVLATGRNLTDGPAADLLADPNIGRMLLGLVQEVG
ncbi:MAG TPA: ABC transporter ATP-binding protein, partial [Limnochordia bacterium]|nr:ABC transporter ATP-binding protein [Limnochordia bacterium]